MAADPATQDHSLSLAFMQHHVAAAARVLEAQPTAEAAEVLARAPARVGGPVLAAMLPGAASLCLAALPDERALELLSALNTQASATLLRAQPQARRQVLLAALPTAVSWATSLLLGHAIESVGAWVDPDVAALPADTLVEAALAGLRQGASEHAMVWVTDASGNLTGVISANALLRAEGQLKLALLQQRCDDVLSAQSLLTSVASHPGWSRRSALPVVDGNSRLLGVLTHDGLLRARFATAPSGAQRAEENLAGGLPEAFGRTLWQSLAGILSVGLKALPRVNSVAATPPDRHAR